MQETVIFRGARTAFGFVAFLVLLLSSLEGRVVLAQNSADDAGGEIRARPAIMQLSRQMQRPTSNSTQCNSEEVGLMLPLTGDGRMIGKAMLDAATLALFDLGDKRLKLRMFDTVGSAEGSLVAAQAVATSNICLVIGPVFDHEVQVVRANIRPEQSPLIAFSSNRGVASKDTILLNFLPEQQLRKILAFASDHELNRLGFVISDDRYGALLAEAIHPLAEELGLEIAFIDKITLDFKTVSRQVSEIAGAVMYPGRENDRGDPRYAVDALVLPVAPQWAITIASLFEVYGVDFQELQLLGIGLWQGEKLDLEPPLEGALFAGPSMERFNRFADRLKTNFGYRPPLIAALAYDAVLLAGKIQQTRFQGRKEDQILSWTSGLQGVLGTFWVSPEGSVLRELQVFRQTPNGQVAIKTPALLN